MTNKRISSYKMFGKKLLIVTGDSINKVEFPSEVKQVLEFDDVLIVRLKVSKENTLGENVFGVSLDGRILWQIPTISHVYQNSPYTSIYREGDFVGAFNWDGTELTLNRLTGEIIKQGYSK